jgi:phosphoenolpyruvate carboxykinase (ATP)
MDQDLTSIGIVHPEAVWWNLSTPTLYEHAVRNREGQFAHLGPLVVRTGQYTGRSPKDKFVVDEPRHHDQVWWGDVNQPFDPDRYERLRARLMAYLQGLPVYVQDCSVGAHPEYRLPVRIITQRAWHSLFARNLFVQEHDPAKLAEHEPEFTLIDAPGFDADPEIDGTRSEVFVVVNLARREVIIGGTEYGGEIKKSMFTVMNFLMPDRGVLPMHCSANYGATDDDVAIFFGLSGTGKTTLSADPARTLIGDDEHGWSDEGVFNFEGGCYAKVIRLSPTGEPEIFETTRRFGTVLENVMIDTASRHLDLDSDALTENTRAAYPISHIPNASRTGVAGQPKVVIMLTADAFGVLPPIARLSPEQASYHFLSGYTAKVAGTERGVTEPVATFSTCFGAPFMARQPSVYASMLAERVARHGVAVYLISTGWTGGPYGVGHRMPLAQTRAIVTAALQGSLVDVPTRQDPTFGFLVPQSCPGVPAEILDPRQAWPDPEAYAAQAARLASMFAENFKHFEADTPAEVTAAGPRSRV